MKNRMTTKLWLAGGVALALLIAAPAFAGFLGITVKDVTSDQLQALKLKEERGVEVLSVLPDSPAAKAGLKEHDVVLEYNGQRVEGAEQFQRLVRETPADRTVRLQISRDGNTQNITTKLSDAFPSGPVAGVYSWPPMPQVVPVPPVPPPTRVPQPRVVIPPIEIPQFGPYGNRMYFVPAGPMIGVDTEPLNAQLGDYFGVTNGEGLLVRSVEAGSPAEKAGIKAGDVVIRVDGEKVTSASMLRSALARKADKEAMVTLIRNRKEMTVTVNVPASRARRITPADGERM